MSSQIYKKDHYKIKFAFSSKVCYNIC